MDVGQIYGRGLGFPPRLGPNGRMLWSSGPENIRESIRIILMTELTERLRLPAFGSRLRSLLQDPNTVATRALIQAAIEQALGRWEPRIDVDEVVVEQDPDDPGAALATIYYSLLSDRSSDQVDLQLQFSNER